MNANIQTITLDLTNSAFSAAQKVSVVQGDSGTRPVKAIITDNGVVRTDLSHDSARLYISNANGERPTYVEGISINGGIAEFSIPQSATLRPGMKKGELRLVDEDGKILTSMPFMVEVTPSQYDEEAVLGADELDVVTRMVDQVQKSEEAAANSAEIAQSLASDADTFAKAAADSAAVAQKASQFAVSYSEEQALTDKQKTTARGNIGVFSQDEVAYMINDSIKETVPKTDVVDNLLIDGAFDLTKIPNGNALNAFVVQTAVSSGATQSLSEAKKARARENISAMVNKEWKVIATGEITEDGVTKIAITKDNNGNPFEIYDALVVYTNAPIAAETANIFMFVNGQASNLAFQAVNKSEAKFARITANWDGGNWTGISLVGSNPYSYASAVGGMTQYNAKSSPATKIELGTENANAPFPIGTKFELRGVVKV